MNYRLKRLKDLGVIKYYATIMNPAKLGHPIFTFVNFTIKDFRKESRKKFESYIGNHPKITYGARLSGKYHYAVCIAAKNVDHFDEIMGDLLDRFSDFVKDYDSSTILEEFKYDQFDGLLD